MTLTRYKTLYSSGSSKVVSNGESQECRLSLIHVTLLTTLNNLIGLKPTLLCLRCKLGSRRKREKIKRSLIRLTRRRLFPSSPLPLLLCLSLSHSLTHSPSLPLRTIRQWNRPIRRKFLNIPPFPSVTQKGR